MEREIRDRIVRNWPSTRGRVFTFKEFVDGEDADLEDPVIKGDDDRFYPSRDYQEPYMAPFIDEIESLIVRGRPRFLEFLGVS